MLSYSAGKGRGQNHVATGLAAFKSLRLLAGKLPCCPSCTYICWSPVPCAHHWLACSGCLQENSDTILLKAAVAVLAECEGDLLIQEDFEEVRASR